ncbi:MAG TPA: FtsW/RodA/SpoVE family cell cycle protein [Vicinamibacterales bacterium]|nr:FtsW/RodA/SpoVE family cell cycle protein [Vicinamibacterales bacterium]
MRIVRQPTRSSTAGDAGSRKRRVPGTRAEALGLLVASLLAVAGAAQTSRRQLADAELTGSIALQAAAQPAVNLNAAAAAELAPVLDVFPSDAERTFAATRIVQWVRDRAGVDRVSALARIVVPASGIRSDPNLTRLNERLAQTAGATSLTLLTGGDLTRLRPSLSVRSAQDFRWKVALALLLTLGPMWVIHLIRRRWTGIGDPVVLPCVTFLLGLGLIAMLTLRDPVRDGDIAISFASGAGLGAIGLIVVASLDVARIAQTLSPIGPALGAFVLAGALLVFGHGPAGSGAKVNLFGVQPGEFVRVFAVAALALYLGRRWELIRGLSKPIDVGVAARPIYLPRPADIRPLLVVVGVLLASFFLLRDLGPALVLGLITLALYGIARGRVVAGVLAILGLVGCFAAAYATGAPATIVKRVAIWMDPWQNALPGGDQIAHALWAMATGSTFGLGPGAGESRLVPAGHTDLVIAVLGEELGYIGLAVIVAVYVLLITRMIRMSAKAPSDVTLFLAAGCTLLLAVPAIVVTMGVLGLMPLSGIATPFLSYGKTSMVCNFAIIGVLLSISRRQTRDRDPLPRSMRALKVALAVAACAILARAFYIQVVKADDVAVRASLVQQADGTVRYQYNYRLLQIARRIPRGTIFDRNGLALATENAAQAEQTQARLKALGETEAGVGCAPLLERCYPLGTRAFHILGESLNRTNWPARNSSFVERDWNIILQGFNDDPHPLVVTLPDGRTQTVVARDYRELLPLVRERGDLSHRALRQFMARQRDISLTIDAPLQGLVAQALETQVRAANAAHGAVVVVDPATGGLLAAASYPRPHLNVSGSEAADDAAALLDRARYGLYPPGSSFKIVTAAAALTAGLSATDTTFMCQRLPDGRVGATLPRFGPIRDDIRDRDPHGRLTISGALVVSCNAFFAQLGVRVGAAQLRDAAAKAQLQVSAAPAGTNGSDPLERTLAFAAYGQGEVLVSPLRMARAVGAIATDGVIRDAPIVSTGAEGASERVWIRPGDAAALRKPMREVVTKGTGRVLATHEPPIAGKTGTAEVEGARSHAWFVGYAPFDVAQGRPVDSAQGSRTIAFAIIIENGGYGGGAAARLAGDVVDAAQKAGVIR